MSRPCECERCDPEPWGEYRPGDCRLCWLYHHDPAYRERWDDQSGEGRPDPAESHRRSLPCVHLGEVLDKRGCPCPGLWLRACPLHGPITITFCKTCPDYEEDP
jgi:hypothetical protein